MWRKESLLGVRQQVGIHVLRSVAAGYVFHLERVSSVSRHPAFIQRLGNGFFLDHGTSSGIHHVHASFHLENSLRIDQVQRASGERGH